MAARKRNGAGVGLGRRPKRKFRIFGQARVSLRPALALVKVGMLGGLSVDFVIVLMDLIGRKLLAHELPPGDSGSIIARGVNPGRASRGRWRIAGIFYHCT
jgi:hypothetical protein